MSRYIGANVLKEAILKERDAIPLTITERYSFGTEKPYRDGNSMRGGIRKALRCLEQTPTADVVEVVRCKDCKCYRAETVLNGTANYGTCCRVSYVRTDLSERFEDDYCSHGERR